MTTARCFGGVLDGRWQQTDGREFLAPVMDWYPALTLDAGDPREPHMRVHRYTLQKFAVPHGFGWNIFHALIGPGFTRSMVKAWLDGWMEEAERIEKSGSWYYWEGHHNMEAKMEERSGVRKAQAAAAKMQTRPGDRARAEVAELERRLKNQEDYIRELQDQPTVNRLQTQNRQLVVDLRDARAAKEEAEKLLRREQYATKMLQKSRDEARERLERCRALLRRHYRLP